jgi:CHAT domain-containing protein
MAEAKTVVSALWPVSDKATAEILVRIYERQNHTFPERFREIQLHRIKNLRTQNEADHPIHWSGFIVLGDWR